MTTSYKEFVRQVMLKLQPRSDGITILTVEQAINDAQKVIAEIKDFDELMTLDVTHAFTILLSTGAIALDFNTHTITRIAGSFITDGFANGMLISCDSLVNPGPFTVDVVAALTMTVVETFTAEAATYTITAGKKLYHPVTDWALVRPKDVYSIRYMDGGNSRKLTFVPLRELDSRIPYTEQIGTGRPCYYTIRGKYVELIRIPNEVKPLYIQHSQWPAILTNPTDETEYENIDHVIVGLSTEMAIASLEGSSGDWFARAKQLLGMALSEEETRPDQVYVAQPFNPYKQPPMGDYWNNPFIKKQP